MKISRTQLKRIIKEELRASLLCEIEWNTKFKKGDKVLAVWAEDGQKYAGTIDTREYASGIFKYAVIWDDPGSGPLTSLVKASDIELQNVTPEAESSSTALQKEILWKVIADEGRSKDWDHLIPLDGGSVGIAHFASGGINGLYEEFGDEGVRKWFTQYNPEINSVQALKDATATGGGAHCRRGSAGNSGPGTCWSMSWWKNGMRAFLADGETKAIQFRAWQNLVVQAAEGLVVSYGGAWSTNRGRAIAYSLTNSGGTSMLNRMSNGGSSSPNDTMEAYNRSIGRVRTRMRVLNRLYPDPNFNPSFQPSKFRS
jgi:hypothetical protein